jgi:hypothetical protein
MLFRTIHVCSEQTKSIIKRGATITTNGDNKEALPRIYLSVDATLTGPPYHQTQPDRKENGK